MKILIAEDEVMMLKTMQFKLIKQGFEVIACSNGEEALSKIISERPDIIITDIMMPFVTGLDIVKNVKVEWNLDIPIIILSAVGLEKTVQEAFDLGADDFITKPFSPNELIVRIKRLVAVEAA
ncbi:MULTISPECIES: response regulator transcription factor [unclassified Flavobacterium]|jgi:DNA-binding response OmpR family regulator|uniref:response regulator transcription factor n=1 Tax=unclassified Flavobacterium TaxID=196869 RepID=UPI003F8F5E08